MSSQMTLLSNHTVLAEHLIVAVGRPSDRSAGLRTYGGRDPAEATQASPVRVLDRALREVRVANYGRLPYWTGTCTVSETRYRYVATGKSAASARDPWDELERLGRAVAEAWTSEKSAVELLLEERR